MQEADPRKRLGELIKARRCQFELSVSAAATRAKLNRTTWTEVERGNRSLLDRNYAKVEATLGWAQGSVTAILAGGQPTILAPARPVDFQSLPRSTRDFIVFIDYVEHDLDAPASVKEDLIDRRVRLRKQAEAERREATAPDGA